MLAQSIEPGNAQLTRVSRAKALDDPYEEIVVQIALDTLYYNRVDWRPSDRSAGSGWNRSTNTLGRNPNRTGEVDFARGTSKLRGAVAATLAGAAFWLAFWARRAN